MTVDNAPPVNTDTGTTTTDTWTAPEWAKDAPAELQAVLKAKGYSQPIDVLKAYDHAQRAIGAEKITLPKDGVWDADSRKKLGIPDEVDGYKVARPTMPDGVKYDEAFEKAMLPIAHKLGLTPQQLNGLVEAATAHRLGEYHNAGLATQQARETSENALRAEWGAAYDAKVEQAKRAISFAGGDALVKAIDAAGVGNNPEFIRAWAKVGTAMGEDKLKVGGGSSFAMTPNEAAAEIAKIDAQMTDPNSPLMNKNHPEHDILIERRQSLFQMMVAGKAA